MLMAYAIDRAAAVGAWVKKCGEPACSPHFPKLGECACDPGQGRPGSQGRKSKAADYMSSQSGSLVTTPWPARPTVDGSVKTISDLRSSAMPRPVVSEMPVR